MSSSLSQSSEWPEMTFSASSFFDSEQLIDSLFERRGADETVHEDRLALTEAVHAIRRLLLHRRVPPPVEVEHMVRRRQVQATAACTDRDHQNTTGRPRS